MPDFLNIEDALSNLDLSGSAVAAEFGCGSAFFAVSLAKKIKEGKVYALDIQEEKLSAVKSRAVAEKVDNVDAILCDLEIPNGSALKNDHLDIVLIPNLLFQLEDKYAIIEESQRVLKTGGQLLVIEHLREGIAANVKRGLVKPEKVKRMADLFGFSLKREFAAGDYHYGLLFLKN